MSEVSKQAAPAELTPEQLKIKSEITAVINNTAAQIVATFPIIKDSCNKAVIALSKVQEITTDEQDVYANNLLVKVRTTYNEKSAMRLAITKPLDELKEVLMAPEKTISTDAGAKDSHYLRVKKERDKYATEKKRKADEEKARIKLVQDIADEKARIRAAIEMSIGNGLANMLAVTGDWCATAWGKLTLENIDEMKAKLSAVPVLKEASYSAWYAIPYNTSLVNTEAFAEIAKAVSQDPDHGYNGANSYFSQHCAVLLKEWADKLPAKKQELENLKRLEAENAAEAERQRAAAAEKSKQMAEEQAARLKKEAEEKQTAALQAQQDAQMNNAFQAQVAEQSIEESTGTRTSFVATLACPEQDIVSTIAEVFYHCMLHPKYEGIIKRDKKTGDLQHDESGRPVYVEWLEKILTFYANNCEHTVGGLKITQKVSSTARA